MVVFFFGCEKYGKNINVKVDSISVHHNETVSIDAKSNTPINYTSMDEYHATVDGDGNVTGKYVGTTKIKLDNGNDARFVNVNVIPRYNIYNEPDISFGESKQSIISKFGQPDSTWLDMGTTYYYNITNNGISLRLIVDFNGYSESSTVTAYGIDGFDRSLYDQLALFLDERYCETNTDFGHLYYNGLSNETSTMRVKLIPYGTVYNPPLSCKITYNKNQ